MSDRRAAYLGILIVPAMALGLAVQASSADEHAISPRLATAKMAGNWKGTGTMTAAGNKNAVSANWTCVSGVAGFGVRCDMHMTGIPGMEEFVENEQIGYDNSEEQVHMGTVCNGGEAHDLKGAWNGTKLRLADSRETFELHLVSANEMQLRVTNLGGGPVFDVRLQK
jgi:hypothetical protein